MICTPELRFVERTEKVFAGEFHSDGERSIVYHDKKTRVLQQKWRVEPVYDKLSGIPMPYTPNVEWRDVPIVKEEA